METAARCDGAATAILHRADAIVPFGNLSERRLQAVRDAPDTRSVARIAAQDPEAVVHAILARSDA